MSAAVAWARRRTLVEWLCLGAGLAVFGYVGWDGALWDARFQLALHLIAIGAIAGLALLALRGGALPHTPIDLPVIALVLAFGIATASAMNLGMSLRATAAIAAYAAMLYVALICIRYRPSWVGARHRGAGARPRRSRPSSAWWSAASSGSLVGAPGIPPIRLPGEVTPFGSVAVPPFVIWPAWALAGLIESPRWRRIVQSGLVAGRRAAHRALRVALGVAGDGRHDRSRPPSRGPGGARHRLRPSGSSGRTDDRPRGRWRWSGSAAAIVLVALAADRRHLADLSRQPLARHPRWRGAPIRCSASARATCRTRDRPRRRTSRSPFASRTRTTCRSACSATPGSSAWQRRSCSSLPSPGPPDRGGRGRRPGGVAAYRADRARASADSSRT